MPNDKKSSDLAIMAAEDLLDGHFVDIYRPEEADPADQNQRVALPDLKTYFGLLKDNLSAVVPPTASDGSSSGYAIGSHWVDTAAKAVHVCVKATVGSAIWIDLSALSAVALSNIAAIAAPTATDDDSKGYSVNSHWVDIEAGKIYVCVDATENIAVWKDVTGGGGGGGDLLAANNLSDLASASAARGNLGLGSAATTEASAYAITAQGVKADSATQPGDNISTLTNDSGFTDDQTDAEIRTATEAATDSNVFTDADHAKLDALVGGANKLDGTTAPGSNDDSADTSGNGVFAIGSMWIDGTASPKEVYRCLNPAVGAAEWANTSLTISELHAIALSGSASDLDSGTLPIARIGAGTMTLDKLEDISQNQFVARSSVGSGQPQPVGATTARSILNVADGADITNETSVGNAITAASSKATPVDADYIGIIDSADSFSLKQLSWANIKATLKTYFDTLYAIGNALIQHYTTVSIQAAAFTPATTNGAEPGKTIYGSGVREISHYAFDAATEEAIYLNFRLWDDYNGGDIGWKIDWDAVATGSGTVVFGLSGGATTDNDALSTALGTERTVTDTVLAVGDNHQTPVATAITLAGTPVAGEMATLKLVVKTSGTLALDALFLGMILQYQKKSTQVTSAWS